MKHIEHILPYYWAPFFRDEFHRMDLKEQNLAIAWMKEKGYSGCASYKIMGSIFLIFIS